MWCQKSFFKSSPPFIQSVKQKLNSDLVFTHISVWIQFLFNHSKSWNLFRSVIFDAISHNGKGLCEVRATATGSGEENETLAKTIFIFSDLQKKMKWFFAGTAYKFSKNSFNPASCKTHVMRCFFNIHKSNSHLFYPLFLI